MYWRARTPGHAALAEQPVYRTLRLHRVAGGQDARSELLLQQCEEPRNGADDKRLRSKRGLWIVGVESRRVSHGFEHEHVETGALRVRSGAWYGLRYRVPERAQHFELPLSDEPPEIITLGQCLVRGDASGCVHKGSDR